MDDACGATPVAHSPINASNAISSLRYWRRVSYSDLVAVHTQQEKDRRPSNIYNTLSRFTAILSVVVLGWVDSVKCRRLHVPQQKTARAVAASHIH